MHLVYYEKFSWVQNAIAKENELKGWRREKKLDLIRSFNAGFEFLEDDFFENSVVFVIPRHEESHGESRFVLCDSSYRRNDKKVH